jgi:hypothetical protein
MWERIGDIPQERFIEIWNAAGSLAEVVERVKELVRSVPRWAVMARATALRKAGIKMKPLPSITPGEGLSVSKESSIG